VDTKQVAVAKLAKMEAPYNPRSISKAELQGLRDSLESYGCVQPIIVNQATNRIVGGHARVKAAQLLGFKSLPVVFVELEELQERDLNLRLNRIGGSFDEALLGELLAELDQGGVDLQATGFTAGEIDSAL
jgi:ParB-like chromosome segregation protein Spo0J